MPGHFLAEIFFLRFEIFWGGGQIYHGRFADERGECLMHPLDVGHMQKSVK